MVDIWKVRLQSLQVQIPEWEWQPRLHLVIWVQEYERIDILVNNAGFISLDRQETKEGLERQFGINHIGHFLLTELLLCRMGKGSRIVIVASGAHKTGKIHFDN